jgi:hypothetical protein
MKKIRYLVFFFVLTLISNRTISQGLTGLAAIIPGQTITTTAPYNGIGGSWTYPSSGACAINTIAINSNLFTWSIPSSYNCCSIPLQYTKGNLNVSGTVLLAPAVTINTTNVVIVGGLTPPQIILNTIYPNICSNLCPNPFSYSITSGAATCFNCANTFQSQTYFFVSNSPAASLTSPIIIKSFFNCQTTGNFLTGSFSVNVALQTPTITGPTIIGCLNGGILTSNIVTYTATQVPGATHFDWTYPAGLVPTNTNNVNGSTISFSVVSGSGVGPIGVTAFNQNGGSVHSGVGGLNVNICCVPYYIQNTAINSLGQLSESGSVIHLNNDILSTGSATMHAGTEIHLLPGFSAYQNSEAHFYIDGCNTGFNRLTSNSVTSDFEPPSFIFTQNNETINYRNHKNLAENQENILNSQKMLEIEMNIESNQQFNTLVEDQKISDIEIIPNPTNGRFDIKFGILDEPIYLIIMDNFGKTLLKEDYIADKIHKFDLSSFKDGMYIVVAYFKNCTKRKTFIKLSR